MQALDFIAAEPSSPSGGDTLGVATLGVALIAAAIALIIFGVPVLRRRSFVGSADRSAASDAAPAQEDDDSNW